ncbi:MAG: L-threonylcarbamoyladenylate synthase [Cyclobacteriaceae bacterium]
MASFISINPDNPEERKIAEVVRHLQKGGVIIYPTDTVYALGCSVFDRKAIERICQIKQVKVEKSQFSFMCTDLSNASQYTKQVGSTIFKLMKKTLPGPYTFIINASGEVPKALQFKKKTVGIKIPDHRITNLLTQELGHPIISTSLPDKELEVEYYTDPSLMLDIYDKQVDVIIDGGIGEITPSTVLDCCDGDIEIVREGLGEIDFL